MNIFRKDRAEALSVVEAYRKYGEVEVVEDDQDHYEALGQGPIQAGWRTICIRTQTDTHTIFYP